MVTRILSGKSMRGLLNYNENKVSSGNAELILANKFGAELGDLELRDKLKRFEALTILNARARTNAIHVMLNFFRTDNLPTEKLQIIAVDYMERIGFGDQPFLVYQHRDASHPHLHIVTTNIQDDGSRISIHNIGRDKDEKIRAALQKEYGLIRAEGRAKDPMIKGAIVGPARYGKKPTRQSIYNIVTAVMREYKFTSMAEYNAVLGEFNVIADRGKPDSRMFERKGLVYAVLDDKGKRIGVPIKASSLAGKPTLANVKAKFESNKIKREKHKEGLKISIDNVLLSDMRLSRKKFGLLMSNKNIGLIFRQSDAGQIYGITYIDHSTRCVFNGSDLGKAYSAKALLDRFDVSEFTSKQHDHHVGESKNLKNKENYLKSPNVDADVSSALQTLLRAPDFDPPTGEVKKRKRKKRKKGSTVEQDLGNQMK